MSSISSRKEQQKPKIGIRALRRMAFERIAARADEYLDQLEELFFKKDRITACNMMFELAGLDEHDQPSKQQSRRPSIINRWAAEIEQQEKEAAAAQEAASRELGQLPEPDPDPEAKARMTAFAGLPMDVVVEVAKDLAKQEIAERKQSKTISSVFSKTSSISTNSNTIVNEIGLQEQGFNPAMKPVSSITTGH